MRQEHEIMRSGWSPAQLFISVLLLGYTTAAEASDPALPESTANHSAGACVNIDTDSARLTCYDEALGRAARPAAKPSVNQVFPHESGAPAIARSSPDSAWSY